MPDNMRYLRVYSRASNVAIGFRRSKKQWCVTAKMAGNDAAMERELAYLAHFGFAVCSIDAGESCFFESRGDELHSSMRFLGDNDPGQPRETFDLTLDDPLAKHGLHLGCECGGTWKDCHMTGSPDCESCT